MRRALLLLAVLLVACGGGDDQPLASNAVSAEGIGVATGRPATWAGVNLMNRSDDPLQLEFVEPVGADPGLEVTGVLARVLAADGDAVGDPNPSVSGAGFPPVDRPGGQLAGTTLLPYVEADQRPIVELQVGLVAARPGRYVLRGLRIRYVANGLQHEGTVDHAVALCVADPDDQAGDCPPP